MSRRISDHDILELLEEEEEEVVGEEEYYEVEELSDNFEEEEEEEDDVEAAAEDDVEEAEEVEPLNIIAMFDEEGAPLALNIDGVLQEVAPSMPSAPGDIHPGQDMADPTPGPSAPGDINPSMSHEPRRRVTRRGTGGRSRGVPRAGRRASVPHWVRGECLVEVFSNDDDLPEDLKGRILNVVAAREAREGASGSARQRRLDEEAWMDADDGTDEAMFGEGESSAQFEWRPMASFTGQRENFLPTQTGPVVPSANAYEAFRQYWDDGILGHIVTETNRYARGLASSSASFAQEWYDTNIHEILMLFAFWMMLGIVRMPTIKSCFTTNPLLQSDIFTKMFTKNRYNALNRALHFADNTRPATGKMHSFGPILDHLNASFKAAYVPAQDICLDESLTLWKGKLSIRQYIRTKVARFGVKSFELCESSTGYLWSFFLYEGAGTVYDNAFPSLPKSSASVLQLVRPLLNKGYTLFMDNWFNSPLLARYLKAHGTDCVGTLRANRRHVPPLLSLCKLRDGQFVARHSGDVVVMGYQDKKNKITTISTYHGVEQDLMPTKPHREPQYKPQVILDYNKSMGGVDHKDQMLEPYLMERKKCMKWYMKVFKRLLNASILNARIHREKSTGVTIKHLAFRLELVEQIHEKHLEHVPKPRPVRPDVGPVAGPSRLHVPKKVDGVVASERTSRRRCVWCIQQHAPGRTIYECSTCKVPLCMGACFDKYHTRR